MRETPTVRLRHGSLRGHGKTVLREIMPGWLFPAVDSSNKSVFPGDGDTVMHIKTISTQSPRSQ